MDKIGVEKRREQGPRDEVEVDRHGRREEERERQVREGGGGERGGGRGRRGEGGQLEQKGGEQRRGDGEEARGGSCRVADRSTITSKIWHYRTVRDGTHYSKGLDNFYHPFSLPCHRGRMIFRSITSFS